MAVKTFQRAVALDEHRAKFKPDHWHAPDQSRPKMAKIPTGEFAMMMIFEGVFAQNVKMRREGKERTTDIDEVRLQRVWGLTFKTDAFVYRCGLLGDIVVRFFFVAFW